MWVGLIHQAVANRLYGGAVGHTPLILLLFRLNVKELSSHTEIKGLGLHADQPRKIICKVCLSVKQSRTVIPRTLQMLWEARRPHHQQQQQQRH